MWIEELMKINNTPDFGFTPRYKQISALHGRIFFAQHQQATTFGTCAQQPLRALTERNIESQWCQGCKNQPRKRSRNSYLQIDGGMGKMGERRNASIVGQKRRSPSGRLLRTFEKNYKAEIEELMKQGLPKEEAEKKSPLCRKHAKCCAVGKRETPK